MSRTNPKKRKPRQAHATAQIVVEGYTEGAFCTYLKRLFAKDCGVRVQIHNVKGGSPLDVIRTALNRKGFDRTFTMYDTDVPLPKVWKDKARKAEHICIHSSPCIEALFLELLGQQIPRKTEDCKRRFADFLDDKEKCKPESFGKFFPKELLVESNHPSIVLLLSVFKR